MTFTGITVDGRFYNVGIVFPNMTRSFEIRDGNNRGDSITGRTIRDVIGTFYGYEFTVRSLPGFQSDYDSLYQVLSSPVESHMITVPYNQTTMTFEAMIESGQDVNTGRNGNEWNWDELSVSFIPIAPQRT